MIEVFFKNFFEPENSSTEELVLQARDWSLNRINELNSNSLEGKAILQEFEEWIDPKENEIDIFSLEKIS
jgi:hypothetical protein